MPKVTPAKSFADGALKQLPAAIAKLDKLLAKQGGGAPAKKPTEFQRAVWAACLLVPKGKVATYSGVAEVARGAVGRLTHKGCGSLPVRAVGQALKSNPAAPHVPCHRVVASDRRMGGFFGETGGAKIDEKVRMLRAEGVVIVEGRTQLRVDEASVSR
jgi:methylated-DNA-[protein]-cysteine S-methyltransferase